jgi:hypothetical protein
MHEKAFRAGWAIFIFIISFIASFYIGMDLEIEANIIFLVSIPFAFFFLFLTYHSPASPIGIGIFYLMVFIGSSSDILTIYLYTLGAFVGGIITLAIAFMWKFS